MKKIIRFNTLLFALLMGTILFTVVSCGDDEDDKEPEPTVDNRDVFIGTYLGAFQCPGFLSFASSDRLVFKINGPIDVADEKGIIL